MSTLLIIAVVLVAGYYLFDMGDWGRPRKW